jgi:hypothetical protein
MLILALGVISAHAEPPSMPKMNHVGPRLENVDGKQYVHVLHVAAPTGTETGPGTAEKPFKSFADAVQAASGANASNRYAILVAEGTYLGDRLKMMPNADVFGSFIQGQWEKRDVVAHPSVLDAGRNGPVVIAADQSRLDGFRITSGKHDGPGGAIICKAISPTISNNIIIANRTIHTPTIAPETLHIQAHPGGAIAVLDGASPQIINNIIAQNTTDVGDGGAIVLRGGSKAKIANNAIVGNSSGLADTTIYDGKVGSRSSNGGAISISDTCAPEITGNVFALNKTLNTSDGGAIYIEYEAAPHIHHNWFAGNRTADDGGHIYIRGLADNSAARGKGPLIESNVFAGSRVLQPARNFDRFNEAIFLSKSGHASVRGNLFTGQGSAVGVYGSSVSLENNTIVNNLADGVYFDLRKERVAMSTVTGNIIWGNAGKQIATLTSVSAAPKAINNIVQGGFEGEGNRHEDPQFVNDSIRGNITAKRYDQSTCTTILSVQPAPPASDLTGRLIQIGNQWSVIRSTADQQHGRQISVWGDVTDGDELMIPGTFLQKGK